MKGIFENRLGRSLALVGLVAGTAIGCSDSEKSSEERTGVHLQAVIPVNTTDVTDIQYTIQQVPCGGGAPIGAPIVTTRPLEDQAIPGTIPELQDRPLDSGSAHLFADAFQVVPAGCYDVTAAPLAGGGVSEDCAAASKRGVVVTAGETTEVFLINQCQGDDPGAVDVIAALNREPVLEDVSFSDSKFACGSPAEVCARASDPDNDPLELVLDAPGCEVAPVGDPQSGSQCWEVTCHELGRANMTVRAYDLLWDNGSLIRIEDFLTNEGYPNESHAQLNFFAYFDGTLLYPDQDGDGFGDANARPSIFCDDDDTGGFVPNNTDCDDQSPTTFPGAEEVCDGADNNCNGEIDEGGSCAPEPGTDVVVFNDINPFDNTGMSNPNNQLMVRNLVGFTSGKPRDAGTVVQMDRGRNSVCGGTGECSPGSISTMNSVIAAAGFTVQDISSTSGSLTNFPPDVKVIILWNPLISFTVPEINAFKAFAGEGGRVVFIGEWDGYYGSGIGVENEFLLNMGAVMTNIGQAVDCGFNTLPGTSLRAHQVTAGMTDVTIACASVIVPGPGDFPLYFDSTNTLVLAGVATIDTTPIASIALADPVSTSASDSLNASSATGE